MAREWSGDILLESGSRLDSIILTPPADHSQLIPPKAALRFLSIVDLAQIPLHLSISPAYSVTTTAPATQAWLQDVLLSSQPNTAVAWWDTARHESPLAVLLAIDSSTATKTAVPPTEVLLYSLRQPPAVTPEHDPTGTAPSLFGVSATILSSALLYRAPEFTPPASPTAAESDPEAIFLPTPNTKQLEIVNEPPVRKRKTASDAFDQADERRRKAKRAGGHSISAAAASKTDHDVPSLTHRRSNSGVGSQPQPRTLSRSPSVSNSRPTTARGASEVPKRSSLSHMQNAPEAPASSVETRNKDLISRTVMACMRLHGLTQSRSRQARGGSIPGSPTAQLDEDAQDSRHKDEEFKLIYHQAYKGVCFAFRHSINVKPLQSWSNALRETADKLLDIYCTNPMQNLGQTEIDEVTPGGRKAFGSSSKTRTEGANIFLVPPADTFGSFASPTPGVGSGRSGNG